MAQIILNTYIKAPIKTVFDLSRSIDLHIISTSHTKEKAVAGITKGLIGYNESVTWQAYHLLKTRNFTSRITSFTAPVYFKDEMIKGDFKSFSHEHFFEEAVYGTVVTDKVIMESPFGILGKFINKIFLKTYIKNLLTRRNKIIKEFAESEKWKHILMG